MSEREDTQSLTFKSRARSRLAIFCGGISGEHEISLISTKHVLRALSHKDYEIFVVVVQKNASMELVELKDFEDLPDNPRQIYGLKGRKLHFRPFPTKPEPAGFFVEAEFQAIDVCLPLIHGKGGEDGSLQGFFETAGWPYVGCDVQSSANGMDKAATKRLAQVRKVPIVSFVEISDFDQLNQANLSFPSFVKPSHAGSSLGIHRVESWDELKSACEAAFSFSGRVLIEPAIEGREIEFAVFDDGRQRVISPAGEIRCKEGFYDYDAKYVQTHKVDLLTPTNLPPEILKKGQHWASETFSALGAFGMARVDFFLTENGEFLLNEINTIPGFTPISMYPKLMAEAGLTYPELVSRLVESAFLRPR